MSADWYFIRRGGFLRRRKQVGPISEQAILARIESGEIDPDTLMSSELKTHGHWVEMKTIKPAMKHYKTLHPET
ncbi:MAG: DUF4339 domain-containing protein [Planctomycetota bacterium]